MKHTHFEHRSISREGDEGAGNEGEWSWREGAARKTTLWPLPPVSPLLQRYSTFLVRLATLSSPSPFTPLHLFLRFSSPLGSVQARYLWGICPRGWNTISTDIPLPPPSVPLCHCSSFPPLLSWIVPIFLLHNL